MSLRELVWMVTERKRVMGELAAWHVAEIVCRLPLTAEALDVARINPYRVAGVEPVKSEELQRIEAWQAARGWRVFCSGK